MESPAMGGKKLTGIRRELCYRKVMYVRCSRVLEPSSMVSITVWDANLSDYRRISFEHVDKMIIDNEEYVIEY